MTEIAIITDSTANIPEGLIERYKIQVAPQVLIWEGETLFDGVDITPKEFYERLQASDVLPTTSQATIASFLELFEPHVEKGTPVLAILVSDELSGTIQSALQARQEFPGATIEIVNSKSVAMALGFQVLAAARAVEAGKEFEEVVEVARGCQERTGVLFVVETLDYLHRGGRIGGASKLLGTALSLKPLLHLNEGKVDTLELVRTKKKATARMIDIIADRVQDERPLRIAALHAVSPEEAEMILQNASNRCQPEEELITVVSPSLGTHVGPGTVGVAYCAGI